MTSKCHQKYKTFFENIQLILFSKDIQIFLIILKLLKILN